MSIRGKSPDLSTVLLNGRDQVSTGDSRGEEFDQYPAELPAGGLANAFVAQAVLDIATTVGLIERLAMDKELRRICGFSPCAKLPSEATFSRAFAQFASAKLGERAHEAQRVTNLYDLMDATYCSKELHIHCRELGLGFR